MSCATCIGLIRLHKLAEKAYINGTEGALRDLDNVVSFAQVNGERVSFGRLS